MRVISVVLVKRVFRKPYLTNVIIVLMKCTFSQELFITSSARGFTHIKNLFKRIYFVICRQCVFQVTGKNAFSAMNNYNSQALKI